MGEMKDSGIEWIGEIPREWSISKLKYLCQMESGDNIIAQEISPEYTEKQCYQVYGANGFRGYFDAYNKKGRYCLIGRQGALAGNVHIGNGKFWATDHAVVVYANTNISQEYMFYLLTSMNLNQYAFDTAAQPGISVSKIMNLPIVHPTKKEQSKIVSYLDAKCTEIDALTADIQRQIDTLEQYKRSVITEAVTKGLNPDAEMKDSGNQYWSSIPMDWHLSDIKYLFEIVKRIAGQEGYDILSVTQKGLKIKDISNNEGQVAESYANYQFVYPGDFVMNHMDLLTGWVDCSELFGVTSPDYRVFRLRDKNNSLNYYKYIMQTCYMNRIFYSLGQGVSTLGRWRLQTSSFNNFMVPVPPIEIQETIANYLDKKCIEINACIDDKHRQLKTLAKYKKSLIYEYVTGKKEVPADGK